MFKVAPRTGGRGLKFPMSEHLFCGGCRPPHRGAWIEISADIKAFLVHERRPPHRGAWIEMAYFCYSLYP